MNLLHSISSLLKDPPPSLAFEVSESGVAMARIASRIEVEFEPFAGGVISVSPLRDNILNPDQFLAAVRAIIPSNGSRKRRDAALILPDYCTRMSVLDFDSFPSDSKEQASLVRFRIKKSVPFDVELAALSYWPQSAAGKEKRVDVVVAVAPLEIVARYEAPFRAAGLNPGLVITSSLAALSMVRETALTVIAKLSGKTLSILVVQAGALKLVRCLELSSRSVDEIASDVYPTFVYIEDNLGARAEKLMLCGFGEEARSQFQHELGIPVETLRSPFGAPTENQAGLLGFVQSVRPS